MKKAIPVIITAIIFIWLINKCTDNSTRNECIDKYYKGNQYKYEYDLNKLYHNDIDLMKKSLEDAGEPISTN